MWEHTFGLDSEKSSPSWKVYITALRRDYSARSKWARRMSASGFLSWRSPNARDAEKWHYRHKGNNPKNKQINLSGEVLNWRTPNHNEPQLNAERLDGALGHRMYDKQTGRLAQVGLTQQAHLWPTPNTAMTVGETNPNLIRRGKKFYNLATGREVQTALTTEVRQWKTPNATDGEGGVMEIRPHANAHLKLRDIAANWNTPRSHKEPSQAQIATGNTKARLENQDLIFQPQTVSPLTTKSDSTRRDPTNTTHGAPSLIDFLSALPPSKKRLNPTFTEWLMGLPLGWTNPYTKSNYPAWEMQFRRLLQDLLFAYWQNESD